MTKSMGTIMEQLQQADQTIESENLDDAQELIDFFADGGTIKDAKGLDAETLEAIYQVAYNLYQNGKYEQALKIFRVLGLFDHYEKKYFMGLAACLKVLEQYDNAIEAYSFATMLDVNDPMPGFYAGECHLALANYEEALSGFTAALHFASKSDQYNDIKKKAETMLKFVKSKMN